MIGLLLALIQDGWADLGVRVEDADGKIVVREVFDSPLKVGDVIVAIDGVELRHAEHLMELLWSRPPGGSAGVKCADREVKVPLRTIAGQKVAGANNWEHHPPAIRAFWTGTAYAFDLSFSFDRKLTDAERKEARAMIELAARIFHDATEGQMYFRFVDVYEEKDYWNRAHYWVRKETGYYGVEHVKPGGQCLLSFKELNTTAAIIVAHEAGHMQLGSGDEYPYNAKDPQEDCVCLMGRGCFQGTYDLCVAKGHSYVEKESCWDNAKRWYPKLAKPEKPRHGPELKVLPQVRFMKSWGRAARTAGAGAGR